MKGTDILYIVIYGIYQPPSFKTGPSTTWDLRRRTEIIPVTDSHTRIKPLALTSGRGRYITVTPELTLFPLGNDRYIQPL
jgi:hypothetical protein